MSTGWPRSSSWSRAKGSPTRKRSPRARTSGRRPIARRRMAGLSSCARRNPAEGLTDRSSVSSSTGSRVFDDRLTIRPLNGRHDEKGDPDMSFTRRDFMRDGSRRRCARMGGIFRPASRPPSFAFSAGGRRLTLRKAHLGRVNEPGVGSGVGSRPDDAHQNGLNQSKGSVWRGRRRTRRRVPSPPDQRAATPADAGVSARGEC